MDEKRDEEDYKHICRLCNKKYPSGKSLGGHMRSHVINDSYVPLTKLKSKKALTFSKRNTIKAKRVKNLLVSGADDSSSSVAGYGEKKSVKEARYKAIALINSFSIENGSSSSKSEIELELEDVALCLMMLSRDSSHKIGTLPESSAKTPVILELKRKYLDCEFNNHNKKLNCLEMDSSNSGYFENGAEEIDESEDSVDGYVRNCVIKKPKAEYRSGFGEYNCSICQRSFKTHQALGGHILTHKRVSKDHLSEFRTQFTKGHCCSLCSKVFKSGKALGGHKRSHLIEKANTIEDNTTRNYPLLIDLNLPASLD